jgi:peptidase YpeB-like protein
MRRRFATALSLCLIVLGTPAMAQDSPAVPPQNAMKLSAIIATVEGRDGFHYVYSVEWNEEGYYDVVYFTADKARVELKVDAVTGKNR